MKIYKIEGYDDGYYWDYRVWFEHDDKNFTYINMGSCSGWIPSHEAIRYGILDLPEGYRDDGYWEKSNIKEDMLIRAAEMLVSSGEEELDLNGWYLN